jgi:hypothetical protein
MPAGTFIGGDVRGPVQNQGAGERIRDDLLQIPQRDRFVQSDDGLGVIGCEDLSVIAIGEPLLAVRLKVRADPVYQYMDVLVRPASVNIAMQAIQPGASLAPGTKGGRAQQSPPFTKQP